MWVWEAVQCFKNVPINHTTGVQGRGCEHKKLHLRNWKPPNRSQKLASDACHAPNRSLIPPPAQLDPQVGPKSVIICKWTLPNGPQWFKMRAKGSIFSPIFLNIRFTCSLTCALLQTVLNRSKCLLRIPNLSPQLINVN